MKKPLVSYNLQLFAILIFSGCVQQAEIKKDEPVHVKTITVKDSLFSLPVISAGKLENSKQIRLSFKTGGIIQDIFIEEGQEVKKGQKLSSLKMDEINANVTLAKLTADKARRDFERAENLYADSVATLEQQQNARTAKELAEAQLKITEFNREHSEITSPTDGVVLKILAEEGEMTGPGHPVFLFGSENSYWIFRTSVSDKQRVKLQRGDSAVISFDAFQESTFSGRIHLTGEFADPYTGTYPLEIRLEESVRGFVSGLIGKAKLFPAQKHRWVYIPVESILTMNDSMGEVFIVKNQLPQKKKIEIIALSGKVALVKNGLNPGDELIVEGGQYIKSGSDIHIDDKAKP